MGGGVKGRRGLMAALEGTLVRPSSTVRLAPAAAAAAKEEGDLQRARRTGRAPRRLAESGRMSSAV